VKEQMMVLSKKQQQTQIDNLANMPLEKAYATMLMPLRFEYMSMKKDEHSKNYQHSYDSSA
jgi:hypothetical protein